MHENDTLMPPLLPGQTYQVDSLPCLVLLPDSMMDEQQADTILYFETNTSHDFSILVNHEPGVAGTFRPYTLHGDSILTLILLASFMLIGVSLARFRLFFLERLHGLFFIRYDDDRNSETSGETQVQLMYVALNCLFLAILANCFILQKVSVTLFFGNNLLMTGLLMAVIMGYYIVKWGLAMVVNHVFFGSNKNLQWTHSVIFITSLQCLLLFPLILLLVYFSWGLRNAVYYFTLVVILAKLLTFYKSWNIFFQQKGGLMQTFLYFCTLEIVPLLAFAGCLRITTEWMRIIF